MGITITAIREKLHDYINNAADDKVMNLYEIFEDQMAAVVDWSEDVEFVAELDERVRRYEKGIDKGYSIEETKSALEKLKEEYYKNRKLFIRLIYHLKLNLKYLKGGFGIKVSSPD